MSRFLNQFHTSLYKVQLLHWSLFLFHRLLCYLHLLMMSLCQCQWKTIQHHLQQSLLRILDSSTLIGKKFLPLNKFWLTPLQWKVHLLSHQHLPLILMFLLSFAKINSLVLIILSHFVFYDRLNLFFRQFALPLSSVSIPRSYEEANWYLPANRIWMRR